MGSDLLRQLRIGLDVTWSTMQYQYWMNGVNFRHTIGWIDNFWPPRPAYHSIYVTYSTLSCESGKSFVWLVCYAETLAQLTVAVSFFYCSIGIVFFKTVPSKIEHGWDESAYLTFTYMCLLLNTFIQHCLISHSGIALCVLLRTFWHLGLSENMFLESRNIAGNGVLWSKQNASLFT